MKGHTELIRSCVKVEVDVPDSPYGFYTRKATLNVQICVNNGLGRRWRGRWGGRGWGVGQ